MKLKYINRVGVEIEGGWFYDEYEEEIYEFDDMGCYHEDGSVETRGDVIGELVSVPMTNINELIKWIKRNYPPEVNHSCGFHIHISLKNRMFYSRLMDKEFWDYFLKKCEEFGHKYNISNSEFWKRLHGENSYCNRTYQPEFQINDIDHDDYRYTQLNYCYSLHNTIECRLFPMFRKSDITILALTTYLNNVENFLKNTTRKQFNSIAPIFYIKQDSEDFNIEKTIIKEYLNEMPKPIKKPIKKEYSLGRLITERFYSPDDLPF